MSVPTTVALKYISTLNPSEKTALMISEYNPSEPYGFKVVIGKQGDVVDEVPLANILHKINKLKRKETIFLNYQPNFIELGMAWRAGDKIQNIYYIDRSAEPYTIKKYNITQDGFVGPEATEFSLKELEEIEHQSLLKHPAFIKAEDNIQQERVVSDNTIDILKLGLGMRMIPRQMMPDLATPLDGQKQKRIDDAMIRLVMTLVERAWTDKAGQYKPSARTKGNNIAAIMLDAEGNLIGWGLNLKGENKTFHAETLMIQRYLRETGQSQLPAGVTIYTSLECCHMCAGHIAELSQGARVVFAQRDPYFKGKNVLDLGVGGCSQEPTSLVFHDYFDDVMKQAKLGILPFLFSNHSKSIFNLGKLQRLMCLEIVIRAHERDPIGLLEYGDRGLASLASTQSSLLATQELFLKLLTEHEVIAPRAGSEHEPVTDFLCRQSRRLRRHCLAQPFLSRVRSQDRPGKLFGSRLKLPLPVVDDEMSALIDSVRKRRGTRLDESVTDVQILLCDRWQDHRELVPLLSLGSYQAMLILSSNRLAVVDAEMQADMEAYINEDVVEHQTDESIELQSQSSTIDESSEAVVISIVDGEDSEHDHAATPK